MMALVGRSRVHRRSQLVGRDPGGGGELLGGGPVEIAIEPGAAGADGEGHAELGVRIEREPLDERLRPRHLLRVRVGDLDLGAGPRLGEEVDGAPVTEAGHGGGGDGPHQLAVVVGEAAGVVELDQELQPLALAALVLGARARARFSAPSRRRCSRSCP